MLRAPFAEFVAKKIDSRMPAYKVRQALIERGRSFHVDRIVKQLMKNDVRQGHSVIAE